MSSGLTLGKIYIDILLYPITTIAFTTSNELYSKQEGSNAKRRTTLPSQYSIASHSSYLYSDSASHPPRPFTVLALRAALTLPT
ncbi:hypothetical protein V1478_016563 [Vespula squamosa]|uniref:Uncharacterized protein n=1 Tax=Vespula squamosa TaxID=30214 RepID=A0ABD2A0R6_VESSQ